MNEEKKYSVGDAIWHSRYGINPVVKTCPVCFGKKEVTLILGNGDEVVLKCEYCVKGFNEPSGTITEYEYVAAASQRTITAINSVVTVNGEEREYMCGFTRLKNGDIFDTEGEALVRSEYEAKEARKEQETKIEYLKKSKAKSFSWNAGYWMSQIRNAKKNIEQWEKRVQLCKARSKE